MFNYFKLIFIVYRIVLFILSLTGNGLICITIYTEQHTSAIYKIIAQQCLSDIIGATCLLCNFMFCSEQFVALTKTLTFNICETNVLIVGATNIASTVCITLAAIERYVKVTSSKSRSMALQSFLNRNLVMITWFPSILWSIYRQAGLNIPIYFSAHGFVQCRKTFGELIMLKSTWLQFVHLMMLIVIPVLTVLSTYPLTLMNLKRRAKSCSTEQEFQRLNAQVNVVKSLFAIAIVYFVLQYPLHAALRLFKADDQTSEDYCNNTFIVPQSIYFLSLLYLVINPFILCYFQRGFVKRAREALRKSLRFDKHQDIEMS